VEGGARVVFPRPGPGPRFRTNAREGCDVMLILRSFFACVSFCFIGYGRIETVGSSSGSTWSVYHTLHHIGMTTCSRVEKTVMTKSTPSGDCGVSRETSHFDGRVHLPSRLVGSHNSERPVSSCAVADV
jgi:hypothetical protein